MDAPTTPGPIAPDAARAALQVDAESRRKAALDAIRAALVAQRCDLVAAIRAECGDDGVTRHFPTVDVVAL